MADVFTAFQTITVKLDRLAKLEEADVRPLMEAWGNIIVEDNRKGVLEGTDKDGNPLRDVTYRTGIGRPTAPRTASDVFGTNPQRFKGRSKYTFKNTILPNNNLATSVYKTLSGGPLAPRGPASRVISNLEKGYGFENGRWQAVGVWRQVVSAKGKPFLIAHFDGLNGLPKRDLRGVRPWGMAQARQAAHDWAVWLLGGP